MPYRDLSYLTFITRANYYYNKETHQINSSSNLNHYRHRKHLLKRRQQHPQNDDLGSLSLSLLLGFLGAVTPRNVFGSISPLSILFKMERAHFKNTSSTCSPVNALVSKKALHHNSVRIDLTLTIVLPSSLFVTLVSHEHHSNVSIS